MEAATILINSEDDAAFVIKRVDVEIKIKGGGEVLDLCGDGYVSKLANCANVYGVAWIEIRILPGVNVFGFYVDGEKDIHPAKNLAKASSGEKFYRKCVPIKIGKTFYNSNHIRLIELDNEFFFVYEIAIVFQNGKGYLSMQRVYEGICYQYPRTRVVVCPEFSKWSQLIEFLTNLHREMGTLHLLDDIADYVPDPLPKNPPGSDLPDGFGRVDWYNVAKGDGGILLNNGMAHVHWSDIISSGNGLKKLLPGQEVAIARLIPSLKKHTFAYKAEGVEVV